MKNLPFVNTGAQIDKNVILNFFSTIEHDAIIEEQSNISARTIINCDCKVGNNDFFGSQSVLFNGISVGDKIVVVDGSVVCKSINEKGVFAGNPAIL